MSRYENNIVLNVPTPKDYFAELPQDVKDDLYDVFKEDFDMFDYDPQKFD